LQIAKGSICSSNCPKHLLFQRAVLFGDVNPGGKLPITFPRGVGQVPLFYSSKPSGKGSFWYQDYVAEKALPLYP